MGSAEKTVQRARRQQLREYDKVIKEFNESPPSPPPQNQNFQPLIKTNSK